MADLGDLLGTILLSIAHARRVADEETAALAEYYKDHPLLETMAIPRIRLREVTLDLPIVIDGYEDPEHDVEASPELVRDALISRFDRAIEEAGVEPPASLRDNYKKSLDRELGRLTRSSRRRGRRLGTENVVRASELAYQRAVRSVGSDYHKKMNRDTDKLIRDDLRDEARRTALEREGDRSRLHTTFVTTDVKERADEGTVTRLRLVIKEEGVEWAISQDDDGSVRRNLAPE